MFLFKHSIFIFMAALMLVSPSLLQAQFDAGSNGSDGALSISTSTTLDLPPDGVFHFTTFTVESGATLKFRRNALNTPVYILAQGDINVAGTISVDGEGGGSLDGGKSGPGGFDGGLPGIAGAAPGDGFGPGGGIADDLATCSGAGGGAYRTRPTSCPNSNDGQPYGNPLLLYLVGGSGGGGIPGSGGSGGGGAILIASNTNIVVTGNVYARGGSNGNLNRGSGGAIRLVAPIVSGTGTLNCTGNSYAGDGYLRIDTVERGGLNLSVQPASSLSVGGFLLARPEVQPKLSLIEVAGRIIPEGSDSGVDIILSQDAPAMQTVRIQARDFTGVVPVRVVLTPESGPRSTYDAEIDMSAGNPTMIDIPIVVPANVPVRVSAWTR